MHGCVCVCVCMLMRVSFSSSLLMSSSLVPSPRRSEAEVSGKDMCKAVRRSSHSGPLRKQALLSPFICRLNARGRYSWRWTAGNRVPSQPSHLFKWAPHVHTEHTPTHRSTLSKYSTTAIIIIIMIIYIIMDNQ